VHLKVNVIFVDNKKIRALSRQFLNEDHETDVIAFPYGPSPRQSLSRGPGSSSDKTWVPAKKHAGTTEFGDIYVSLPMAQYNAEKFGASYKQEVTRLVVHGLLHLLGYSDLKPKLKKKMWAKQEKLVGYLESGR